MPRFPSKDSVYEMYGFLYNFEHYIAQRSGEFNIDSSELNQFIRNNNIEIKPVSKSKYVTDLPKRDYIVFLYGDHKEAYDDKAHDLLRHIRNSISHGNIEKVSPKRAIFDLTDKNKNKNITLRGNIHENLFFALLQKLIDTGLK